MQLLFFVFAYMDFPLSSLGNFLIFYTFYYVHKMMRFMESSVRVAAIK